jgi:hypothetical protein
MRYTGEQLRKAMLVMARREWLRPVKSIGAPGEARITEYWDACGWGAWLRENPGCAKGYKRVQGSGVDYCGIFLGFCGLKVGEALEDGQCVPVRLRRSVANHVLPSTYRMTEPDRWKAAKVPFLEPIAHRAVEPGDIITVATGRNKHYGDHFAIVDEVMAGGLCTIEGNASGKLGDQTDGHGVIFRTRPFSAIRRVYRLGPEYFEEMD